MPDWLATVLVAAGSAAVAAVALVWRAGRKDAEMTARIDAAASHGESAHDGLRDLGERVRSLETHRAVHDERITRMAEDLSYIRQAIDDLRGRAR